MGHANPGGHGGPPLRSDISSDHSRVVGTALYRVGAALCGRPGSHTQRSLDCGHKATPYPEPDLLFIGGCGSQDEGPLLESTDGGDVFDDGQDEAGAAIGGDRLGTTRPRQPVCVPYQWACADDETRHQCAGNGSGYVSVSRCGEGDVCSDGFCLGPYVHFGRIDEASTDGQGALSHQMFRDTAFRQVMDIDTNADQIRMCAHGLDRDDLLRGTVRIGERDGLTSNMMSGTRQVIQEEAELTGEQPCTSWANVSVFNGIEYLVEVVLSKDIELSTYNLGVTDGFYEGRSVPTGEAWEPEYDWATDTSFHANLRREQMLTFEGRDDLSQPSITLGTHTALIGNIHTQDTGVLEVRVEAPVETEVEYLIELRAISEIAENIDEYNSSVTEGYYRADPTPSGPDWDNAEDLTTSREFRWTVTGRSFPE